MNVLFRAKRSIPRIFLPLYAYAIRLTILKECEWFWNEITRETPGKNLQNRNNRSNRVTARSTGATPSVFFTRSNDFWTDLVIY